MPVRYDIALTNNDILFNNGDMVIAESDEQHIIDTINCFPGWWKENPFDGVGIMAYAKSPVNKQEISKKMRTELLSDNYNSKAPTVDLTADGKLTINPNIDPVN